jgi:serine/threonine-protein kinase
MPLANGQIFAGYRILRMLGSGGMGEVYLAQHPRLPKKVALKVLAADVSADPDYRARFTYEAERASELDHQNIVVVHDRDEEDGQLWISMQYVDGLDAARLLTDKFPSGMPPHQVAKIVTAVASALDYAHDRGLVHRDVKPANIMITNDEQRILLADFGIARNLKEISSLTATGFTVGTVAYAAPEQLTGQDLDGRADQYALAATAYHLLSGSHLFPHSNPAVVIGRHLNTTPPQLSRTRPELAAVDVVLATALAKKPVERFPQCKDLARAFALAQMDKARGRAAALPPERAKLAPAAQPTAPAALVQTPAVQAPPPVDSGNRRRNRANTVYKLLAVIGVVVPVAALVMWIRPWEREESTPTRPPTIAAPSLTFDAMRDFVTGYYIDLPASPMDAWKKLDAHCQSQTGLQEFLDFWATIQSVTVVSISPRDPTSVVARLTYVRRNGTSDTEDRWLKIAAVDGALLLDESGRVGAVNESTTTASTTTSPPVTTTPPYQPENEVDQFLRHAHGLGIHHQQGDGALVAAGNHMCDSVRTGVPIPSVVLGNTAMMVQNGVNEKDADAFVWYALNDLCGSDLFARLPPGGYCVEGGIYNGTTQQCMSDQPTQSPAGATVTLPTSPVVPPGPRGDCSSGDDCHGR